MNNSNRKYILVKGGSGLGNRILAAATAILYGKISNRNVIIDWTEGTYAPHGINAFHCLFDSKNIGNIEDLPITNSIYPSTWKGKLNYTFGGIKEELKLKGTEQISFDVSKIDYQEELIIFCSYSQKIHDMRLFFTGEYSKFQQLTNSQILKLIIDDYFSIKLDIKNQFDQFIKENFTNNNIGVHIRYSDMKIPVEKIYQKVDQVKQKNPKASIFLATDSQEILREFQQRYNQVIITEKWYPSSGGTLHQNWQECENPLQNGIEALQDLYLLSQCQHLIFSSQSSFGYMASLFNEKGKLYDIQATSFFKKIKIQLIRFFAWLNNY